MKLNKQKLVEQGGKTLALAGGIMAGSWGVKALEKKLPTWSVYATNGVLIAGALLAANLVGLPLLAAVFMGIAVTGVVMLAGKLVRSLNPAVGGFTPDEPYSDNVNGWGLGDLPEAPPAGVRLPDLGNTGEVYTEYTEDRSSPDDELLKNRNIL